MEITRLAVVALNHAHFDAWCRERGVSPTDRRLVHALRTESLFRLSRPVSWVLIEWPSDPSAQAAVRELRATGMRVTDDELAAFLATLDAIEPAGAAGGAE